MRLDWERSRAFSPAFILTASHYERDGYQAEGSTADFALDQLRLELCPLRAGNPKVLMHYCATGSGGSLRAGGVQTYGPRTRWRPWWVVGASTVLTVRPTKAFELTLALGAGYALIQDSFQFAPPSPSFYDVKPISVTGSLGVGLRLP